MPYIGSQPTSIAFLTDQFSGTGSQTAFTMSVAPANPASVLVSVSGVLQDPSTYSVSGTTLTFTGAPPSGTGNISCRYLGIPASGVTTTAYRTLTEFTATAGQTTFTPPSYTVGFILVWRNGVLLGSADYTASNGTTVVLTNPASSGDLITTESFYVSSVLNAIPATAGSVGSTYLASNLTLTSPTVSGTLGFSNGTTQSSASKVLQVVNATFTSTVSTSSSSFVTSGVTASITPKFSTSNIFILSTVYADTLSSGQQAGFTIYRNSTNLGSGASNNTLGFAYNTSGRQISGVTLQYLDSPSTTSSTTYTVYMNSENGGSIQIGNASGSIITLMEIAQ